MTGAPPDAQAFFEVYLAAPIVIGLYILWKIITKFKGPMFVRAKNMDLMTGLRSFDLDELDEAAPRKKSIANLPKRTLRGLF